MSIAADKISADEGILKLKEFLLAKVNGIKTVDFIEEGNYNKSCVISPIGDISFEQQLGGQLFFYEYEIEIALISKKEQWLENVRTFTEFLRQIRDFQKDEGKEHSVSSATQQVTEDKHYIRINYRLKYAIQEITNGRYKIFQRLIRR